MNKLSRGLFGLSCALTAILAMAADNPDAAFYRKAAEGGIAEVELGKLAQEKSTNPSVKDFGAMMVRDHTAANEKLKAIAESKNIKLPSSPSVMQMGTKAKLEVLSGDTFDKSYIEGMIKDHQDDIKEFQDEAAHGQDSDARAYATATLPTLQRHLKKIQAIAAAQGITTH
jgi:putative membrane protein